MQLKLFVCRAVIACSSVILGACGLGEIASPTATGLLDSDGDGVPDEEDPQPSVADPNDKNGITRSGDTASGKHKELGFSCNPDTRAAKELQRLTRREYTNTLRDLITRSTDAASADAIMTTLQPSLASYPADAVHKGAPFATMDQSVSQSHVDALIEIGGAVASELTSSPQRLQQLVGSCAGAKSSNAGAMTSCVDGFIAKFGRRALRHELNEGERKFYREVYGSSGATLDTQGIADVITVMLNAPDFIYRVEYGAEKVAGKDALFELDDFEIATRLAYQFWQTAPDDELLEDAASGELGTDAGYTAALDRVLEDPRAGETLEQFVREWLRLDTLRPLDSLNGTPVFDAFAGKDKPNATLTEEMIQDVTDSLAYHALREKGTLQEWLESPYSFAKSQELAAIYNTPVWDGKGAPPRMPEGERAGLITRAALLATGSANTRPIMKGVLIREHLLCDELGAPPANAFGSLPDLSGEKTTRELVEAVTQQPGSACAGCHTTQINPLGFATEGFDALGRKRATQDLYDAAGKVIASKPIDSTSVPRVWMQDTAPSSGPAELTSQLIESGKVEACFAREWVRYSVARDEEEEVDGCELEAVRGKLDSGESILEALRAFALLPKFRQRLLPNS
jgi:hypothetical protein